MHNTVSITRERCRLHTFILSIALCLVGMPAETAFAEECMPLNIFPVKSSSETPIKDTKNGMLFLRAAMGDEVTFSLKPLPSNDPTKTEEEEKLATKNLNCFKEKSTKLAKSPTLTLNGMQLGPAARLVNTESWTEGKITFVLETASPPSSDINAITSKDTGTVDEFWKSVFRQARWYGVAPQTVEIHIEGIGTIAHSKGEILHVAASTREGLTTAILSGFVILSLFIWALVKNEVFRDKPPSWLEGARALVAVRNNTEAWKRWLTNQASSLNITETELKEQARLAYLRLKEGVAPANDSESQLAATGAVLGDSSGDPPTIERLQVSYSLSRVQMGAWAALTVVGGLFIWAFLGKLPLIPDTYLALLGISGATKLLSSIVDNSKEHSIGCLHKSFLTDITAGTNGGGVHRYQSLMVNVLLLLVVAFDIYRNLSFKDIDSTWLILLFGSSAIYLGAKKIGEEPPQTNAPPPPATSPATVAPVTPADGYVG